MANVLAQARGRRLTDRDPDFAAAERWLEVLRQVRLAVFRRLAGSLAESETSELREVRLEPELDEAVIKAVLDKLLESRTVEDVVEALQRAGQLEAYQRSYDRTLYRRRKSKTTA